LILITGTYTYYARQQACTAHKTLVSVQRAFITIAEAGWTPNYGPKGELRWISRVQISNTGDTASVRMNSRIGCSGSMTTLFEHLNIPGPSSIGPRASESALEGCFVTEEDMQKIVQAKDSHKYVGGWSDYWDVFGNQHRTEFCIDMSEFSRFTNKGSGSPDLNARAVHCPTHNCTDEDCKAN
jgi:hypothetical protein